MDGRNPFESTSQNLSPLFGQTNTTSLFGQNTQQSNMFGQTTNVTTTMNPPNSTIFGPPSIPSSNVFGQASFGQTSGTSSVPQSSSIFGGTSAIAQVSNPTTVHPNPSVFGGTSSFSQNPTTANPNPSVFGGTSSFSQNATTANPNLSVFGGTSSFSQNSTTTNATSSIFGGTSTFGTSSSTSFGQTGGNVFQQPNVAPVAPSAFGHVQQTSTGNVFSQQSTREITSVANTSSAFSQIQQPSTQVQPSLFGNASNSTPSLFGQVGKTDSASMPPLSSNQLFGQSNFSQSKSQPASVPGKNSGNVFGNAPPSNSFLLGTTHGTGVTQTGGFQFTSNASFGQNTTAANSDVYSKLIASKDTFTKPSSTGLFGKPDAHVTKSTVPSTAGEGFIARKTLFGKPSFEEDQINKRSKDNRMIDNTTLFGKPTSREMPNQHDIIQQPPDNEQTNFSGAVFGKPVTKSKSDPQNLFGSLRQESLSQVKIPVPYTKPLFAAAPSQSSDTLFGKPAKSSSGLLFGKVVEESQNEDDDLSSSASTVGPLDDDISVERGKRLPTDRMEDDKKVRKIQRLGSSSDDISELTAITCKGLPRSVNNAIDLRKHFSQFGSVSKVFPQPTKGSAVIHFKTHNDASHAKRSGRIMGDNSDQPMQIFWSTYTPGSRTSRRPSLTRGRLPISSSSEADDELATMSGTCDTETQLFASGSSERRRERRPSISRSSSGSRSRSRSTTRSAKVMTRSPSPPPDRLAPPNPKALLKAMKAQAKTAGEKVQVLDSLDKLLRLGHKKSADLASASVVIGTCEYMCTEKECYDRENSRRLSIYEVLPETDNIPGQVPKVNRMRAVKEYSRSSADKEEPLPHELRPGPQLLATMNYLFSEIADKGEEGKWGDWFDFLWNRTRGIRKDITQQMLCNHTSVSLTERCTRFHIYCAQRLCEQDPNDFDPKINDENLTKCLQSLKELYHDLNVKSGLLCSREAEFRAYTVLMNLNQGDILREVQQFRRDIRESQEIKFALRVYAALNSHNYSRFFKLVKMGSYLCACIMHRYFTQVRAHAITVMLKAYTAGKPTQYRLQSLQHSLAFESIQETITFCLHYGLEVSDDHVILDRTKHTQPETALLATRAVGLIESRLQVTVGELINGEPLPVVHLVTPQSSFDANGYYIGDVPTIADIPTTSQATDDSSPPTTTTAVCKVPNEIVKDITREYFHAVIKDSCQEIATNVVTAIEVYMGHAGGLCEGIVSDVVLEDTRAIAENIHYEESIIFQTKRDEMLRKEAQMVERMAIREQACTTISLDIIEEVVNAEIDEITSEEIRAVKEELYQQSLQRSTADLANDIIQNIADEICREISAEVHQTDIVERDERLDELRRCVELSRMSKFWYEWKLIYTRQVRLKRAMLTFPCEPSSDTQQEQIDALIPFQHKKGILNNAMYLNQNTMRQIGLPITPLDDQSWLRQRLSLNDLLLDVQRKKAYLPFNIGKIMAPGLLQCEPYTNDLTGSSQHYVKILLALPDTSANDKCDDFCDWVKAKFRGDEMSSNNGLPEQLEQLQITTTKVSGKPPAPFLNTCVLGLNGLPTDGTIQYISEHGTLHGTTALWFVTSPQMSWENCHSEFTRLQSVIVSKPEHPQILLVIVIPHSNTPSNTLCDNDVVEMLQLAYLHEQGLISGVYLLHVEYCPRDGVDCLRDDLTKQFTNALEWCSTNHPGYPSLTHQLLQDYVEDSISAEMFAPVLYDLAERRRHLRLHQAPEMLIALYNTLIDHIIETTTNQQRTKLSWPVMEFSADRVKWNSPESLNSVRSTLVSLYLPNFIHGDTTSDDWMTACNNLWNFTTEVVGRQTGSHSAQFYSRVRSIVRHFEQDFESTCRFMYDEKSCDPTYINMPWTDIILAAIDYRIHTADFCYPNTQNEMVIYYNHSDPSTKFQVPKFWREAVQEQHMRDEPNLEMTFLHATEINSSKVNESSDELITDQILNPPKLDIKPICPDVLHVKNMCSSISHNLVQAKLDSNMFEAFLENAIKIDDISISSPSLLKNSRLNKSTDDDQHTPKKLLRFDDDDDYLDLNVDSVDITSVSEFNCLNYDDISRKFDDSEDLTIADSIAKLKLKLDSQRRANQLYEEKLLSMINS